MGKTIAFCFTCLVVFASAGCSMTPKVATLDLQAPGAQRIVQLRRNLNAQNRAESMGYEHPHAFSAIEMAREVDLLVLRKFRWGKYGLDSRWIAMPVFLDESREKLIPALVAGFREATSSDRIAFSVAGRHGRPTAGEVYLAENSLVWILATVDGIPYTGKDRYWMDSEQWTIEDKPGLIVREDKVSQTMKVIHDLAAEVEETSAEPQKEQTGQALKTDSGEKTTPSGPKSLEEKLETLKRWKDSGLIGEEEYKREKERILKQL